VRTTIIHCDRCQARIDGPMSTLAVAGEMAEALPRIDLCGPCGRAMVEWLRAAYTPRGEPHEPPADGSHDPARRRLGEAPRPSAPIRPRLDTLLCSCQAHHDQAAWDDQFTGAFPADCCQLCGEPSDQLDPVHELCPECLDRAEFATLAGVNERAGLGYRVF
jgi:hypothetical protein